MRPRPKSLEKLTPGAPIEVEGVRQDLVHSLLTDEEEQAIDKVRVRTRRVRATKKFKTSDAHTREMMLECAAKRRSRVLHYIYSPEEGESVV